MTHEQIKQALAEPFQPRRNRMLKIYRNEILAFQKKTGVRLRFINHKGKQFYCSGIIAGERRTAQGENILQAFKNFKTLVL